MSKSVESMHVLHLQDGVTINSCEGCRYDAHQREMVELRRRRKLEEDEWERSLREKWSR